MGVNAIAAIVHYSVDTVRRWMRRAKESGELHDNARSGRPPIYPQEIQLRLVAFYCQTQPLPACGRWTLRWAAQRLKVESTLVGAAPSKSTLHRILQSNRLKPHQSSYFLHITDPDFFPKMEHLVGLYRNPPQHLIFFDECPGIQILKRLTPDLQTDTMGKRLEEFEYIRNGTLDVLAFLHHVDGTVYLECQSDHKTDTFLAVFRRHASRYSQTDILHYVMDNLSSHRGYPFCQLVAELSGITCPPEQALRTQAKRVEWLGREDKRIIVHFTPYHGSWLNWIEFWFAIMGRKVLGESFGSADQLKAAIEAFAKEWNLLLAHPFRWSYDGKGLHEKAVQRFTKMLHRSDGKMQLTTLTKQMRLLTNLLRDYLPEVSKETWEQLYVALCAQAETIDELILGESGPVRMLKAQQAALDLSATLYDYFFPTEKLAI
jgi:transposase